MGERVLRQVLFATGSSLERARAPYRIYLLSRAKPLRCWLVFLPINLVRFRERLPRSRFFGCVSFAQHIELTVVVCDLFGISVTTSLVEHSFELVGQQRRVPRLHVYSPSVHNILRQFFCAFRVLFN